MEGNNNKIEISTTLGNTFLDQMSTDEAELIIFKRLTQQVGDYLFWKRKELGLSYTSEIIGEVQEGVTKFTLSFPIDSNPSSLSLEDQKLIVDVVRKEIYQAIIWNETCPAYLEVL